MRAALFAPGLETAALVIVIGRTKEALRGRYASDREIASARVNRNFQGMQGFLKPAGHRISDVRFMKCQILRLFISLIALCLMAAKPVERAEVAIVLTLYLLLYKLLDNSSWFIQLRLHYEAPFSNLDRQGILDSDTHIFSVEVCCVRGSGGEVKRLLQPSSPPLNKDFVF